MPYVMDEFEYGVQSGTMNPDDKDTFYSRQDCYCPRMDDLKEMIGKTIIKEAEMRCYTYYKGEWWNDDDGCSGYLNITLSTTRTIPLSFVNPQTNVKENIVFDFGKERFRAIIKLYGEDGREWDNTFLTNNDYIIPGNSLRWKTELCFYELAKVGEKCRVSIQMDGIKFLGTLLGSYDMEGVFEEAPIAQNIDNIQRKDSISHSYDLQGLPVNGMKKDIYIYNGKKVMIR